MFPRSSLTLVTAPALEPVTLQEAKNHARIDTADDDALLNDLIAAARLNAEEYLRRSLVTQSWRLTLDPCSGGNEPWWDGVREGASSSLFGGLPDAVSLPKGPVQTVTSVTTTGSTGTSSTFASTNYYLDTAGGRLVLYPTAAWPSDLRSAACCAILFAAGYGDKASDVPQPIRTAILMHVARMYDERLVCEMPEGCQRLLNPYRVLGERRG